MKKLLALAVLGAVDHGRGAGFCRRCARRRPPYRLRRPPRCRPRPPPPHPLPHPPPPPTRNRNG